MRGPIRFSAFAIALTMVLALVNANTAQAESTGGSPAFPPGAHPYGQSMQNWYRDWWRWAIGIPFDHHPSLDPTGANCAVEQKDGKTWFLGAQGTFTNVERSCTVPKGRSLVIGLSVYLNDFPCPDPDFKPAPGQTLEDFLTQGARQAIDTVDGLTMTVDGKPVRGLFEHRVTTRMFTFTGHLSMQQLDSCITGEPQQAVADGYMVMLKPMRPGVHTIAWSAHHTSGHTYTVRYNITV